MCAFENVEMSAPKDYVSNELLNYYVIYMIV